MAWKTIQRTIRPPYWRHGDRVVRFATAAVVCAVAGFAAVVSYAGWEWGFLQP